MPLIKCPDCGKEVSDQAAACPKCGHPIKAQIIEATSKQWKIWILIGALSSIFGTILLIAGMWSVDGSGTSVFGMCFLLAGLLVFVVGRFGKWWEHE